MQRCEVKGVLHHATNNVLGEHEVAEQRSIRFQAHVHANVLPIIPSTGEVQDETSIMSRIMSDATDGVHNHAIHHLCRRVSRNNSSSQEEGLTEPRVISKDASGHGASDLSPSRDL